MKPKFFIIVLLGVWMTSHALASGQVPAASSAVKPAAAPAKAQPAKNPVVSGNVQNHGHSPASVGGPAKSTKGTGEIAGAAVAHKH
jgi:hypothetical protein